MNTSASRMTSQRRAPGPRDASGRCLRRARVPSLVLALLVIMLSWSSAPPAAADNYTDLNVQGDKLFTPWALAGWCPRAKIGSYWGFGVAQYCRNGDAMGLVLAPLFYGGSDQYVLGLMLGTGTTIANELLGAQIGPVNITKRHATFLQAGVANVVGGQFSGLQMGAVNIVGERMYGIQTGVLNLVQGGEVKGLQIGAFNIAERELTGIQLGLANWVGEEMKALQIGALNVATGPATGLQIGSVNWASSGFRGVQIGGLNVVTNGEFRGLQLGGLLATRETNSGSPFLVGMNLGLGWSDSSYMGAKKFRGGVYIFSAEIGYGSIGRGRGRDGSPPAMQGVFRLGRGYVTFWKGFFSVGATLTGLKGVFDNDGARYGDLLIPGVLFKTGRLLIGVGASWFNQVVDDGNVVDIELSLTLPLYENDYDSAFWIPALQITCTIVSETENFCGAGINWPGWQGG